MEMSERIKIAKKRRAKLLTGFTNRKNPITVAKFAAQYGITASRMSLILRKARKEAGE